MRPPLSGAPFARQMVPSLGGEEMTLGKPGEGHDWQMIVIYRGLHCPICKDYMGQLDKLKSKFHDIGVDVVAVSGDSQEKSQAFVDEVGLTLPVGYDLGTAQMQDMGLYISEPRSPEETDRPFSEPGLFVVNGDGQLQIVDISNAPFARPDLERLAKGLKFVRDKDYPIRGTWTE